VFKFTERCGRILNIPSLLIIIGTCYQNILPLSLKIPIRLFRRTVKCSNGYHNIYGTNTT